MYLGRRVLPIGHVAVMLSSRAGETVILRHFCCGAISSFEAGNSYSAKDSPSLLNLIVKYLVDGIHPTWIVPSSFGPPDFDAD